MSQVPHDAAEQPPKRGLLELAEALDARADCVTGQDWEAPATAAMMHEGAMRLREAAKALVQLESDLADCHAVKASWEAEAEEYLKGSAWHHVAAGDCRCECMIVLNGARHASLPCV